MATRFSASARPARPAASLGSASASEVARLIFLAIVSASSTRLMRLWSEGSDLLIFFVPSRRLITRAAGPRIIGSTAGKKSRP